MVATVHPSEIEARIINRFPNVGFSLCEINEILEQRVEQRTRELAEANRFIQKVTDTAPFIIYVYDLIERRNVYASREAGTVLGYSPEQLHEMGNALLPTLMHPDDLRRYSTHVENIIAVQDGEFLEFEYRMRHANGLWRVLYSRDTIFQRDAVGQVVQILGTAEDVTEQREAVAAARKTEERFRTLIENSSDIITLTDQNGSILYMSPSIQRILGHDPASLISKNVFRYLHPDDTAEAHTVFAAVVNQPGITRSAHFRFQCADGSWRYLEGVGTNLIETPGINAIVVNARDISERVAAEERSQVLAEELTRSNDELKRRNDELQRSNRELEDFASVASHDLQEPLRKIQTLGDLLERRAKDTLTPECKDYVDRMLSAARRMQSLVRDVLSISRVTTSASPAKPVDLNHIFYGVLNDLEQRIVSTGGAVQMIGTLPHLEADGAQMRQLLQNLIGNALKFHRPNVPPFVTVQGDEYEEGEPGRRWVRLVIMDNGVGFDPQYATRIFQMFERLEGRNNEEGTGVGLAICRKIVERHHGVITADSKPGKGATFTIILPQSQPESRPEPVPEPRLYNRRATDRIG